MAVTIVCLHDRACMNLVLLYRSLLFCEPVVSGDPNPDAVTVGMPDNDLCIEYRRDQEDIVYGARERKFCPLSCLVQDD